MNTGNYQNLFKSFVANLCNGNFVGTFDKQKIDGIVTKEEFQAIMFLDQNKKDFASYAGWNGNANNTSGYRDLVDSFWNSFDINNGDGKIKGTGIFNLNALDKTESTKANTDLKIHKMLTDALKSIKKYINTYNFLSNRLLNVSNNDLTQAGITNSLENLTNDDINILINSIININNNGVTDAMKKDIVGVNANIFAQYNIPGFYDVNNDEVLARLIEESINEPTNITDLNSIIEFFANDGFNTETIEKYFEINNDTKYDENNNYQKAKIYENLYEELLDKIDKLYPELKKSNFDYENTIREKIINFVEEYLSSSTTIKPTNFMELKNYRMEEEFFVGKDCAAQVLYDYLYTLTLYDIEKKDYSKEPQITDAEGNKASSFEQYLYKNISEVAGLGADASKIVDWLAENDVNNQKYQNVIQKIAQQILNNGKNLTIEEIHKLIYDALGVKSTDGVLSQTVIDSILEKKEPQTVPDEEIVIDSESTKPKFLESEYILCEDLSCELTAINYAADAFAEEFKELLDDIKQNLIDLGYEQSILEELFSTIYNNEYAWISKYEMGHSDTGIVSVVCNKNQTWTYTYKLNTSKLKKYIAEQYNKMVQEKNPGIQPSNLQEINYVKPIEGENWTIEQLLNDTGSIGGLKLSDFTSFEKAKENAKDSIKNYCNGIKSVLIENKLDESKVTWAITTTINYYCSVIDALYDYSNEGNQDDTTVNLGKVKYLDASGNSIEEDCSYGFFGTKKEKDIDITTGNGMKKATSGTGIRLEEAHNGNSSNTYTIGVNASALLKNIERFFKLAP